MSDEFVLLVVAKAPVPGLAKTRLTPPATPHQAAEIAAAALLDSLDAVLATPGAVPVVAMTGDVAQAARTDELRARLDRVVVVEQRGARFADRLANAHADAGAAVSRFADGADRHGHPAGHARTAEADGCRAQPTRTPRSVRPPTAAGGCWA